MGDLNNRIKAREEGLGVGGRLVAGGKGLEGSLPISSATSSISLKLRLIILSPCILCMQVGTNLKAFFSSPSTWTVS